MEEELEELPGYPEPLEEKQIAELNEVNLGFGQELLEHKRAEQALWESEERFRAIWHATADAAALSDPEGIVLMANPAYYQFYGYTPEEVIGQSFAIIFPEEQRTWAIEQYKTVFNSPGIPPVFESSIRRADGSERIVETRIDFLSENGQRTAMLSIIRDITERKQLEEVLRKANEELERRTEERTAELEKALAILRDQMDERKQAEEALRQSEERFRLLVESVVDYAIFMLDPQGHIASWNAGAERIKGYRAEEIIGQHFSRFYPAEDVQRGKPEQELVIAKAEGRLEDEGWRVRKDGSLFWANVIITALYDQGKQLHGFTKVTRDFTERKQAEEALRQSERELAETQRRLIEGREAERLQLAQELHDGPVQELYGVIYILSDLAQAVTSEADQAHFASAQELLRRVLQGLRTMASEARPPTLAPFGLEKAIRSHIEQFQQLHPELEVKLDLMPDGQTLPEEIRLALFRIYQAALANVVRHAVAHQVFIRFSLDKDQVGLEVQDDGLGFELPNRWLDIARQGHLGLIGMVERAESIGGQLNVISATGQGTLIQAIVPRPQQTT